MVANNLLEIYTLIFAWNMYEAIWDTLVGTGLALIPFIAAFIVNFRDNYHEGDVRSTIAQLEMTLIGMILVMMLCVIPFKGWEIELATVRYDLTVPDCNPPANITGEGDNTGTAYDDSFSGMGGLKVYKPVAWSFVEFLSTAITHTTIKSMACVNNYEFMLLRISNISIQDQELRQRVRNFHEVCYKKALERYEINPLAIPANVSEADNIDWIGSGIFNNALGEYYRHPEAYMTNMQEIGFNRMPGVRDSDMAYESGAHPYCYEVWRGEENTGVYNETVGLRQQILNDIPLDEAGDVLEDWMDWGYQVITTGPVTDQAKEDLILKMVLQADASNLASQSDVSVSNNLDVNKSWLKASADTFFSTAGVFTSIDEYLRSHTVRTLMKTAGPMILALIQMVVIFSAPFVMTIMQYRLSAFFGVALTYFTFEFINAIWAAAFWFDNKIVDIYMSQAGWLDIATNSFIISAVSAGGILLLPLIWMSVMVWAGAGMVRGMGAAGVGGGVAAGSGAFNHAFGRIGGAAWSRLRGGGGGGTGGGAGGRR